MHATIIEVTKPGKRKPTSAVTKYEVRDVSGLPLKFWGKQRAHTLSSAPVENSIVPTEITAVGMVSRENQVIAPALREKISAPVRTERSMPAGITRTAPATKPAAVLQMMAVVRRMPLAP